MIKKKNKERALLNYIAIPARNMKTMINMINLHRWYWQYFFVFALKWSQYITSNQIKVTSNIMSASSIVCLVRNICLLRIHSFLSKASGIICIA